MVKAVIHGDIIARPSSVVRRKGASGIHLLHGKGILGTSTEELSEKVHMDLSLTYKDTSSSKKGRLGRVRWI